MKQYAFKGLSGCVTQFRSRATGTVVGIYHGAQSGLKADPKKPWVSVCEEHNTLTCRPSLLEAKLVRDPRDFCGECHTKYSLK